MKTKTGFIEKITNIKYKNENDEWEKLEEQTETMFVQANNEPDYIKIYCSVWSTFEGIPTQYHGLFYQIAIRMSYCNANNLGESQLVVLSKPIFDQICLNLGMKRSTLYTGLNVLMQKGAIKRVCKGTYQVNPRFAGKGEWKFNKAANRGGIEKFIAKFDFINRTNEIELELKEN